MMKKIYFLSLILLIPMLSFGQKDEEAAKQLIKDVFEDIWSELDSTKLSYYHTDDFLILENGEVWTNDSIANYQKKQLKRENRAKRNNRFEFVKVEKSKNTIWLAYQNYATWTSEGKLVGKAHWLESAVAIKVKGKWKLKMLHSTYVKEDH
jgi:hypothetical protein